MLRRRTRYEQEQAARKVEWLSTPLEHFCEKAGEAVAISLGAIFTVLLLPVIAYTRFTWREK